MYRTCLLFLIALLTSSTGRHAHAVAQTGGLFLSSTCASCLAELEAKPKEIQFGLHADAQGDIWFVSTDAAFFERLIGKAVDGIAVDVVPRSLYRCGYDIPPPDPYAKGKVLPIVRRKQLLAEARTDLNGHVFSPAGKLPKGSVPGEFELNLLLYKGNDLCHYTSFHDLQAARWDLLNMGLYMDTIVLDDRSREERRAHLRGPLPARKLHFTIPFQRNSAEVRPSDLAPMLDSLRAAGQRITHVEVSAFSSVEGPEARNIELQEARARAIADVLTPLQQGATSTTHGQENWVEFLRDVHYSEYAALAVADRAAIKKALTDRRTLAALEPLLAFHRKALVTLDLRPVSDLDTLAAEVLVQRFEQAVTDQNLLRARAVQQQVMARITDNALPSSFLDRLEVPAQREWATLLNSRHAFKHFNRPEDAYATYLALQELDRLLPDDPHIRYNLCAVKFRLWLLDPQTVVAADFKKEIADLYRLRIPDPLVERMLLNHALVMAELHMIKKEWARKDDRLDYVSRNYRRQDLSMPDRISLAQYFASFGNLNEARQVLEPYVSDPSVAADAVFYYLNLTIYDRDFTGRADYRRILANAGQRDRRRFCTLFNAYGHGGIMFQLLEDPHLKQAWCDICP